MIECQSMNGNISLLQYSSNSQSDIDCDHNCDMDTFGTRLRLARKEAELSQKDLAKKAGLSQTTISDIERGRNEGSTEAVSLASILNVNALWLADGKGPRRNGDLLPSPDMQAGSKKAEFKAATQKTGSHSHSRPLVQTVCDLAEQINDDGLRELAGFARCLTGTHPVVKAKRA